jgi:AraC-like DNA-binding protein
LLQLWAAAIVSLHPTQDCAVINHGKLRDRFRQLINQITAAEFCSTSSKVFAQEIGCSERYFNSLFSEEFGILPRTHQTKLRTQYALQPLENAHPKICPSSVTPATGFSPDTADNSIRQVLDKIPGLPVSTTTRKSKGKQAVPRVGRVTVLLPTKTN